MPRHSQSSATLVGKYITCTCKCSVYCNVHGLNYTLCNCLVSSLFLSLFLSVFLSISLSVFLSLFHPLYPCRFLLLICLVILDQVQTLVGKYITCRCKCSVYFNVHVFNYTLCHCLVSYFFHSFFLSVFLSLCPPCRFLLLICLVILNQVQHLLVSI